MDAPTRVWRRGLRPALLFGIGLGLCLFCGRRGFMPLDQSIVFDGGWRILGGQVPFRDYVAPNGFAVHALQALFFAAFGVSWLSYCLHAAVVNGLFAVCVDRVLRLAGAAPTPALLYAAASALLLGPPLGVPYMDTHAFFFSLVAVWLALEGRRLEGDGRSRVWPWLCLPGVLALAGLSKQIPSVFALPLAVGLAGFAPPATALRRGVWGAAGAGAVLLGLLIAGLALDVDPERLRRYGLALPAGEAARRLAELGSAWRGLWQPLRSFGLGSLAAVQLAFAIVAGTALARGRRASGGTAGALPAIALAQALLAICLGFAVLTLNQVALALPYLFLAAGLAHAALERLASSASRAHRARALRALALCVPVLVLLDAWRFHTGVNLVRSANDLRFDAAVAARESAHLPPALAFLRWQVPRVVPYDARDLARVTDFLSQQEQGFLLLGDASVLYGLTGHASTAPALWLHPGLTLPRPGEPALRDYEDWLLRRIGKPGVRYLVLEGRHTWNHVTLDDFPRLSERVRRTKTPRRRFGGFRVVDLVGEGPG